MPQVRDVCSHVISPSLGRFWTNRNDAKRDFAAGECFAPVLALELDGDVG